MESQAKYMFQEHSIKFLYTHKFGSAEMSNVASWKIFFYKGVIYPQIDMCQIENPVCR